jgi:hypothetical protein
MGQLYTGSGFGKRWNDAWGVAVNTVFGSVYGVAVDRFPQDLFDELLATAFWNAADSLGGVPLRVSELCDVPDRPVRSWGVLSLELARWRVGEGL